MNDQSGKSSQEYNPEQNYYESQILVRILKDEWIFASDFHPEPETYRNRLNDLDPNLAVVFKSLIMTEKLFTKGEKITQNLEMQFLKSKLGDDQELMEIAKKAILAKELEFARKLNKAVRFLGKSQRISLCISSVTLFQTLVIKFKKPFCRLSISKR